MEKPTIYTHTRSVSVTSKRSEFVLAKGLHHDLSRSSILFLFLILSFPPCFIDRSYDSLITQDLFSSPRGIEHINHLNCIWTTQYHVSDRTRFRLSHYSYSEFDLLTLWKSYQDCFTHKKPNLCRSEFQFHRKLNINLKWLYSLHIMSSDFTSCNLHNQNYHYQ